MLQPPDDPLLVGFAFGTMVLSALTIFYLTSHRRNGLRLHYEPRRPVPWNAAATLLAALYLVTAVSALLGSPAGKVPEPKIEASNHAEQLIATSVSQIVIVGSFLFVIVVFSHATRSDLGLPSGTAEFARCVDRRHRLRGRISTRASGSDCTHVFALSTG